MTIPIQSAGPQVEAPKQALATSSHRSWKRLGIALAIAAASDAISFWITLLPPLQWTIDLATAFLLFLILGRRWALLPGLIAEAIPGMGIFPVWILVVASIAVYDDIRTRKK